MGVRKQEQNGTNEPVTGKKLQAAQLLASPDFTGTITELLKQLNIGRTTFYRWMDDPEYIQYINSLIDKYTDSELSTVWKALIEQCKSGNTQAIKLYFELKGKYKQALDISGDVKVIFEGGENVRD